MNVTPNKLELRPLRLEDESSFRQAITEFKAEVPPFEFAFEFDESVPFQKYIEKLENWSLGIGLPDRCVPASYLVGVVDGNIVGRLSLRHCLNDFLEKIGGHIGYAVVPGCRTKGYATEMLKQALPLCKSLGIRNVLLTCDVNNHASMKVIEHCGGVFESETDDPKLVIQKRRYWINL